MFVPASSLDIVPARGLVALVTLLDSGVRFTRDLCRDHLEVHHVVARRCLVALVAVG